MKTAKARYDRWKEIRMLSNAEAARYTNHFNCAMKHNIIPLTRIQFERYKR